MLSEFKFTDAAPNSILPFALVEVAVRPSVDADTIWLILVVIAKVDAFVGVHIASKSSFLVALPVTFVLRPIAGPRIATESFLMRLCIEPADIFVATFPRVLAKAINLVASKGASVLPLLAMIAQHATTMALVVEPLTNVCHTLSLTIIRLVSVEAAT